MAKLADDKVQLHRLMERNDALERENKILRDELANLKPGQFGRRSERIESGQLLIFNDLEGEEPPKKPIEVASHPRARKAKGHGRAPFPEHLPREPLSGTRAGQGRSNRVGQRSVTGLGTSCGLRAPLGSRVEGWGPTGIDRPM